jgi:hypothetical protein
MAEEDKVEPPPQAVVGHMINGFWLSYSIMGAARLGVADALDAGPTPVARIAERVGANVDALYRLMRALASVGIFREEGERTFAHTPRSEVLKRDTPGSMHGVANMVSYLHSRAWPEILHSLQTGHTAFSKVFGKEVFEYLPSDAEAARAFDAAMAGYTFATGQAVVSHYDFSRFSTVVDIGGGSGALLTAILGKFPQPRGINFDLTERARVHFDKVGLGARAQAVAGDFFQSVPAGDCYTLSHILHDWDDDRSRAILQTIRRSIATDGRVCLVEAVVPPGNTPSPVKFLDINMLVMTGGRERTEAEYAALLSAGGFSLTRVVPCGRTDIVEARPA